MKQYLAKMVFSIMSGNGLHTPQFDEQIRLIQANNKVQAFEKARHIGKSEEEEFLNEQQQTVKWQFIDVTDIFEVKDNHDGVEVFSRIEEVSDAGAHKNMVHHKAIVLQTQLQPFF